jgi:hypothetical protein
MFEDSRPLTEGEWKIIYCRHGINVPYPKENQNFWSSLKSEEKEKIEPSHQELGKLEKILEKEETEEEHDSYSYAPNYIAKDKLTIFESSPIPKFSDELKLKLEIYLAGGIILKHKQADEIYELIKKNEAWEKMFNTLTVEERIKVQFIHFTSLAGSVW